MREDLVDGVRVEEPAIHGLGVDLLNGGPAAIVRPVLLVPLLLFLLGELVVADAIALELERHRDGLHRHEELVLHRVVEVVCVGRDAVLQFEQRVRVAVNLVDRGRREPHEQRVEVVEDGAVLLKHRAVRLVDDHQVEVAHAKAALPRVDLINQPHHRRVGRDVDAAFAVALGDEVDRSRVRQVGLERIGGLPHQRLAIGEEEHPLDPVGSHQHVGQRDDGARLA